MKIVWLGNIALPAIAEKESLNTVFVGGWMVGLSKMISACPDISLCYIFDSDKNRKGCVDGYSYYGVKCATSGLKAFGKAYEDRLVEILKNEQPDVIHIWGTETPHSFAMVNAAESIGMLNRVVISIQGMVSAYSRHYCAFLSHSISSGYRGKDFLQGNLLKRARIFEKKGKFEIEALKRVKHVIGRTDWDRALTTSINPSVKYHFNNEMLRDEFYSGKWNIGGCEKHSIFCSQAHYPIKGLHLMLEALLEIKKTYPDVKLYIGGKDYYKTKSYLRSKYEEYIIRYIYKNSLTDNVIFTGNLNSAEMKRRYLASHVFVSPSSIENSPNSVCEAMLLGVPVVSSYVGGVGNLIDQGINGYYYQADAPYMLAYYIKLLFSNDNTCTSISEKAITTASQRHHRESIVSDLINIYLKIKEAI